MIVQGRQLAAAVKKNLPSVVAISSDDTFLLGEAADNIRAAAHQQGFKERLKLSIDRNADWDELIHQAQSLSLFGERQLIEIRLPTAKPGDVGAKAIQEYLQLAPEDNRLLLLMGKLEASSMRSKWFKSLEKDAMVCRLWPIAAHEMPGWIANRLRDKSANADKEAILLLAERVEGNLLAAAQEIDKLVLLANGDRIQREHVVRSIGNSARYNPFELMEACLIGDTHRALRTLDGLQAGGTDAREALWAMTYELRKLSDAISQGGPAAAQAHFKRQRMARQRAQAIQAFLSRCRASTLSQSLSLAAEIDRRIKGASPGNSWDALTQLVLLICGAKLTLATA